MAKLRLSSKFLDVLIRNNLICVCGNESVKYEYNDVLKDTTFVVGYDSKEGSKKCQMCYIHFSETCG